MATRPPPDKSTRGLSGSQAQKAMKPRKNSALTQPWQADSSGAGHSNCFLSICCVHMTPSLEELLKKV